VPAAKTSAASPPKRGIRYWLEITDREDLGGDLKAPQAKENGELFWSYSFIKQIVPGDIVFHYQTREKRIVASSRAVGGWWDQDIVWAARGTSARRAGTVPRPRPGWYRHLESFSPLARPLTLDKIKSRRREVIAIREELESASGEPAYFPFPKYGNSLRSLQGYLFPLPLRFIELFDELHQPVSRSRVRRARAATYHPSERRDHSLGLPYQPSVRETPKYSQQPFAVDPAVVERGMRGHRTTEQALVEHLRTRLGLEPRSASRTEPPPYDLLWTSGDMVYVAEIKSITDKNEEEQLRYGLGQLLRYKDMLKSRGLDVQAVLVPEREPRDRSWHALCGSLGVLLIWPGHFESLR
jgi:hypothetical protein